MNGIEYDDFSINKKKQRNKQQADRNALCVRSYVDDSFDETQSF